MSYYNFFFIIIQFILLIPSFFLYGYLVKKTKISNPYLYATICTIGIPIILTIVFFKINSEYIYPSIRSEKFNIVTWTENPKYRYRMVRNLIEQKILIGKTKNEIIELLGSDYEKGPCENCIGYSTNEPDAGFSIDHEVLHIDLSAQNKVTNTLLNAW